MDTLIITILIGLMWLSMMVSLWVMWRGVTVYD